MKLASVFFGSNYKVAEIVDRYVPVIRVYCERKKFNRDIYNFSVLNGAEFILVDDLDQIEKTMKEFQIGVVFGFSIIFNKKIIRSFKKGIINIHPGDLPDYRGRHPISWGFRNGLKMFGISLHLINDKIDQGILLSKGFVDRSLYDTEEDILKRMVRGLDLGFFAEALNALFSKSGKKLKKGTYYPSLANESHEIDPSKMDRVSIFNWCMAQASYNGIIINGKRYKECCFVNEEFPELEGFDIFKDVNGMRFGLR